MSTKIYTNEQILTFHKQYIATKIKPLAAFSRENNLEIGALRRGFERLNLAIIPAEITHRKFQINENFFDQIDTEEKAYMLGFFYADGCNMEKVNAATISLAKKDEEILIKFSKLLFYNNIYIKEYTDKNKYRTRVILSVINKSISKDLAKHGCVQNKTFILKFPAIPEHLKNHFIRGYFDGDGMLTITTRKFKTPTIIKVANFSITSTMEMLLEIKKYINILGIHAGINKRFKERNNNNYTLRISGNRQIKLFCDYLYKNATIYLERKYQNYIQLCKMPIKIKISDKDFIEAFNNSSNNTEIAKKLAIHKKTVRKRIKKLNLIKI